MLSMAMNGKKISSFFLTELGQRLFTSLILAFVFIATFLYYPMALSCILIITCILVLVDEWPRLSYKSLYLKYLTPLYPVLPFVILIALNSSHQRNLVALLFLAVTVFDTGSYFVGKIIGRHKIAPTISPGKTWEGFIGGCFFSLAAFLLFTNKFLPPINIFVQIFVSLSLSIAAFFGDLWASYLKRRIGLKDTGTLLPGHGGILDRFDGILFAAYSIPVLVFIQKILGS